MPYVVTAANDNDLGRSVIVHMSKPSDNQISILAELFCVLLDEKLQAANDNDAPLTQRGS